MEQQIYDAGFDLVRTFASLDFTQGGLYYLAMTVLGLYICLEGYRISRVALSIVGFFAGFLTAGKLIPSLFPAMNSETLLMIETGLGIVLALLSWFLVQVGVLIAAYQFSMSNLVPLIAGKVVSTVEEQGHNIAIWQPLISIVIGAILAFLAVKAMRPGMVIFTAVLGGFAIVNGVYGILVYFPEQFAVSPPDIPLLWVGAKIFLSCAGVGVQGVKDPNK